jgi:hypothetical protein
MLQPRRHRRESRRQRSVLRDPEHREICEDGAELHQRLRQLLAGKWRLDLEANPGEHNDISAKHPDKVARRAARIDSFLTEANA